MSFRHVLGAALIAIFPVQAGAANSVCVTESEAKSVALFLAPDVLRTLSTTCRPLLNGDAYLGRSSDQLVARYRTASSTAWPNVQVLLGRIPEVKMFRGLNEEGARGMIAVMLEDKALGKLSPGDCSMANDMLEALDPLPPQNMATLLVTFARFGESMGRTSGGNRGNEKQPKKPSLFCGSPPVPLTVTVKIPTK